MATERNISELKSHDLERVSTKFMCNRLLLVVSDLHSRIEELEAPNLTQ